MKKCGYCDMKGFLSFLILWMLKDRSMNGKEIALELQKRKGTKPSPGTIYPALKELSRATLISANNKKYYSLTVKGKQELKHAREYFCCVFYDFKDITK